MGEATYDTFVQSGGHNTVVSGDLVVGDVTDTRGVYRQSGGTLVVVAGALDLGEEVNARSHFILNLPAHTAGGLQITAGTLIVGDHGTGEFDLRQGNLQANLQVAVQKGSFANVVLKTGTLTDAGGDEVIGAAEEGGFVQSGGTNTIAGNLIVWQAADGDGRYTLHSGSLTLTGGNEIIGDAGIGPFAKEGGTNTTDDMLIGKSGGTFGEYKLQGGTLTIHDAGLDTSALAVTGGAGAQSFLTITAGTVQTPVLRTDAGTVTDDGSILVADSLEMATAAK